MTHRTIDCVACEQQFTVDEDQDASRCVRCGTKYEAPWDEPIVISSPILDDEQIRRANVTGGVRARKIEADGSGRDSTQTAQRGTDLGRNGSDSIDRSETTIPLDGAATVRITIEIIPADR